LKIRLFPQPQTPVENLMNGRNRFRKAAAAGFMAAFLLTLPGGLRAETPAAETGDPGLEAELVKTETGIYYTVKKGDTLWGLSRKFADSPYLWPDLWSGNPQIANPHRIYPGERIRLYRREDVDRIPAVAVEPPVEATETALVEPLPMEPPVEEKPAKPLGVFNYSRIEQVGFIRKPPVEPYGRIFKVRDPKKMIATDDIVYISHEGGHDLMPGRRYTVYRTTNYVWEETSGEYLGVQHVILGVVEITQDKSDYSVGKVVRAYINIKVDDLLMPYERRLGRINRQPSPKGLSGHVIMAEEHNLIIGDNVIAFIDRGERDGVKPGQAYNVVYRDQGRIQSKAREKIELDPVVFGEFLVIHTEENTATVYITKAVKNITPGTEFVSP
jgi:hypothetical protein